MAHSPSWACSRPSAVFGTPWQRNSARRRIRRQVPNHLTPNVRWNCRAREAFPAIRMEPGWPMPSSSWATTTAAARPRTRSARSRRSAARRTTLPTRPGPSRSRARVEGHPRGPVRRPRLVDRQRRASRLYLELMRDAAMQCAVVSGSTSVHLLLERARLTPLIDEYVDGNTAASEQLRRKPWPRTCCSPHAGNSASARSARAPSRQHSTASKRAGPESSKVVDLARRSAQRGAQAWSARRRPRRHGPGRAARAATGRLSRRGRHRSPTSR